MARSSKLFPSRGVSSGLSVRVRRSRLGRPAGVATGLIVVMAAAVLLTGCPSKKAAATVNGETIYAEQLDSRVAKIKEGHPKVFEGKSGAQTEKLIRKQTLETMIRDVIVVQAAGKAGVTVSDEEIEKRVDEMKKLFQSEAKFKEALKKQQWTLDDFRNNLRSTMLQQKMMEKLGGQVKVSPKDVADFYKKNKKNFAAPAQVKVGEIVVKTKSEADSIKAKLEAGENFAALAKRYSTDAASKANGGDMGWRGKTDLEPTVSNAAFELPAGGVSAPVKSALGYVLVKVSGKRQARTRSLSEVRTQIEGQLKSTKQGEAYQKWLDGEMKKADIKRYI